MLRHLSVFAALMLLPTLAAAETVTVTKDGVSISCQADPLGVTVEQRLVTIPCDPIEVDQFDVLCIGIDCTVGAPPVDPVPDPTPTPTPTPTPDPVACSEGALCVGPDLTFDEASKSAVDGDVIEFSGDYQMAKNEGVIRHANAVVRSAPGVRAHVSCEGVQPAWSKACLLATLDAATIENLEISGAAIPNSSGGNAACIRNEPNMNVTIRGVHCHDSQNGFSGDGGTWLVEDSLVERNGNPTAKSRTHNMYFSGPCVSVRFIRSVSRNSSDSHALKSRCAETIVEGSELHANGDAAALDASEGGTVLISDTVLTKPAQAATGNLIAYAYENCDNGPGGLTLNSVGFGQLRESGPNYINNGGGTLYCQGAALELIDTALPASVEANGWASQ